jgi:hypothetical protein
MWPRFRPRFVLPLLIPPESFHAAVREAVKRPGAPVTAITLPLQVELRLPEKEQKLFTPVLNVVVREDDDGKPVLKARFAPHPHLWTLVISLYFALVFIGIGGAMYAASQVIMGGSLWSLAVLPIAAAVGGFIHGGILIGQGLSADQMHVLRTFLERTLEDKTRSLQTEG